MHVLSRWKFRSSSRRRERREWKRSVGYFGTLHRIVRNVSGGCGIKKELENKLLYYRCLLLRPFVMLGKNMNGCSRLMLIANQRGGITTSEKRYPMNPGMVT